VITDAIVNVLEGLGGEVGVRGGEIEFRKVLAERRAFLARKKLVYRAHLRVDGERQELHFSESLTEMSSGLSGESGAGFKAETYRTRPGRREGEVAEQAKLFAKVYAYTFDYGAVRGAIEDLAREHGYTVRSHLAPR
jgi:hypothetical protein